MVILSAQDSLKHINEIAPALFKSYPSISALSKASSTELHKIIGGVRNFANKTKWLKILAETIESEDKIPSTVEAVDTDSWRRSKISAYMIP